MGGRDVGREEGEGHKELERDQCRGRGSVREDEVRELGGKGGREREGRGASVEGV